MKALQQTNHDGNSACMCPSTSLCRRHALDAVHAALPPERVVRALSGNLKNGILDTAAIGLVLRNGRGSPAARVGKSDVHAEHLAEEQGGLGATDTGLELEQRA